MTASAEVINVTPSDDLQAVVNAANDGDILILSSGTYNLNPTVDDGTGTLVSTGAVKIYKTITIKGDNITDQPVLLGRFEIYDGAGLTISQCVVDGSMNSTTDQIFNYKLDAAPTGTTFGALDIESCTITGRQDGKGLLFFNVQAIVESITFNDCIIYGIETVGGDFIDSRAGLPRQINLTNSTFYNVAQGRDFIRIDDKSENFPGQAGPVVTVDHCTLYNVGVYANGAQPNYRLLYVRFLGNEIIFTNNLVVGTVNKRGFTNQYLSDAEPTLDNNYYFECENLTSPGLNADASIKWFDVNGTVLTETPFANAAPDFTLKEDCAPNFYKVGDPRWLVTPVASVMPYAVLSNDNTTLTFYYDDQKWARGGMNIGPFESMDSQSWYDQSLSITSVVFDDSFAQCTTITNTAYWFNNCSSLTSITGIENLNTSNVTDMRYMFHFCTHLTSLDVTHFNTAKVTNMRNMFDTCSGLTSLDVSNFNTENVTDMTRMFQHCSALTSLDVSTFNTANVGDMSSMFFGCVGLTTIYCNDTWNCIKSFDMFFDCTSLIGAIAYDETKVDVTYANPDTGYFTRTGDTAITKLKADDGLLKGTSVFSLGGQQRSQPQKGINIIGGKKVVVK